MKGKRSDTGKDFLSQETGTIRRKWRDSLPVALVFPNTYRVGMSNLGFQLIYRMVNSHPGFVCERFFLPDRSAHPCSVESNRPLADFAVILCSVSFEEDFARIPAMLYAGGIEPFASQRSSGATLAQKGRPLLIGGGVAMAMNPEPVAPFFDLIVAGEAEVVLPRILEILAGRSTENISRSEVLHEMALSLPGCYVPALYGFRFDAKGILQSIESAPAVPSRINRVCVADKDIAGHSTLLSPDAEFSNLFLVELGRGCSRGCRFCAAGFVYRPPRLWSSAAVIKALRARPAHVDRVGLLGMEMAKPEELAAISTALLSEGCSLSFSSLRADAVGAELLQLLSSSGLKSVTIAPDGGSDRLRRVINKNMERADILQAAEDLLGIGIKRLKIYFMIGLPTETDEDLEELVDLALSIREKALAIGRRQGFVAELTLSVNCIVPKPWTPFQFYSFPQVKELQRKREFLRKRFVGQANIRLNADAPVNAFYQAVLARGDRRLAPVLAAIASSGRNWRHCMKAAGLDPELYASRERGRHELFPWEILDHGISREYLWQEYQRALAAKSSAPCDVKRCRRCGVCE